MGKAAAFGLAFLGVITLLVGLLMTYVALNTWAIAAGQYFIAAILLFIVTGFLFHKANKSARRSSSRLVV